MRNPIDSHATSPLKMGFAEFIIGPAHRVRPLAGPMASSGRTRWLNPSYTATLQQLIEGAFDDGCTEIGWKKIIRCHFGSGDCRICQLVGRPGSTEALH